MLIDVAIPGYRNVTKNEAERILKYKDLKTEIQRMSNVKAKVGRFHPFTGHEGPWENRGVALLYFRPLH